MVAPNAGILSLFLFDVILVSVPLVVPSTLLINVFLSKTYMKRQWESAIPSVELLDKIASVIQAMF